MKPVRSDIILQIGRERLKVETSSTLIKPDEINSHFDHALRSHAAIRPNVKTAYYDGGFTKYHLPADWVSGLSKITELKFQSGGRYTGEKVKAAVDIYEDADATAYAISNVSAGATQVTLSVASYAGRFKSGDAIALVNAGADAEYNHVASNGNAVSGSVALSGAAASTYNSSPKIRHVDYFRLRQDAPAATDLITVLYGIPHVYTDVIEEITVPEGECDAVADLAASYAARALAALFSQTASSTLDADTFDSGTNAEKWTALADHFEKLYKEKMGIKDEQ